MKKTFLFCFVFFLLLFLISFKQIRAQGSEYVLPYPSYMPGNIMYLPSELIGRISSIFYFGDFGRLEYLIKESDHYLVEAKTLFEYKQYLLGVNALEKSNTYFKEIPNVIIRAKENGKDTSEKELNLANAAKKHAEILTELRADLPAEFTWTPEKDAPTEINFSEIIGESMDIRTKL